MKTKQKLAEEVTRHEKLYYLLNSLTKKLGETVWGSAAFDIEVSKARNEINSLIDAEVAQAKQEERERTEAWLIAGIGYEIDGVDYIKLDDVLDRFKAMKESEENA